MAISLIGLKIWASIETSSMAMLGSLADSSLDLLASLVVLMGVRIAAAPADSDHRFGHGKAEALAALVQVILITLSALFIGYQSVIRLINGAQTSAAELGIGVSLVAIAATLALITYQRHVVKRTGSVAISTDRLHYASDLMLNGSVIVALVLDQYANLTGADAVFGVLIALWLLWGAWTSSSHALDQLMDREWPEELRAKFLAACGDYPELAGLHDLRTRTSGTHNFAQFHVWVPADWTIAHAHDRMDRIEEELQSRFPATEILIHLDPEGHTDRETMLPSEITETAS
ncbi:cation diffusion facilitator family transporter [Sphingomonas daechungensis]|uniref:Cation diffusion facilitator family transporter n=2 Tax=Sphingomonas daechungensis TaxID=1176646 RepID=A0ABX6T502_9SPHN|nr:cation diffusion facilitator family transporter [Sphingomonas daechungensis]QNP44521.1 cation diffusion facilitator family transporter [Sphingomonas daechungensis]